MNTAAHIKKYLKLLRPICPNQHGLVHRVVGGVVDGEFGKLCWHRDCMRKAIELSKRADAVERSPMHELIGKRCVCVFEGERNAWPIPANAEDFSQGCFPAMVIVDAIAMPMVKMRSIHLGIPVWVNCSSVRSIREDLA